MRVLKQTALIFLICVICEGIASILPFPFPGSVLSMIVLFLLFALKVLKVEQVKETSNLLLNNMTLVFVPSFVAIMNYFDVLKYILVRYLLVIILSTIITFFVAGGVVTLVSRLQARLGAQKEV